MYHEVCWQLFLREQFHRLCFSLLLLMESPTQFFPSFELKSSVLTCKYVNVRISSSFAYLFSLFLFLFLSLRLPSTTVKFVSYPLSIHSLSSTHTHTHTHTHTLSLTHTHSYPHTLNTHQPTKAQPFEVVYVVSFLE